MKLLDKLQMMFKINNYDEFDFIQGFFKCNKSCFLVTLFKIN